MKDLEIDDFPIGATACDLDLTGIKKDSKLHELISSLNVGDGYDDDVEGSIPNKKNRKNIMRAKIGEEVCVKIYHEFTGFSDRIRFYIEGVSKKLYQIKVVQLPLYMTLDQTEYKTSIVWLNKKVVVIKL